MSTEPSSPRGHPTPNGAVAGRDGPEKAVLKAVLDALRGIEYGSVLIKIHQGNVVGIETSTKVRLDR
jgi:hypothetical protein